MSKQEIWVCPKCGIVFTEPDENGWPWTMTDELEFHKREAKQAT